jgi:hypothetical protein
MGLNKSAMVKRSKSILVVAVLASVAVAGALLIRVERVPATPHTQRQELTSTRPDESAVPPPAIAESQRAALRAMVAAAQSALMAPGPPLDEASLTEEARELLQSDPDQCIRVAREGNERFPGGANAPERASLIVKSLMRMGRAAEATAEAAAMVEKYPGTPWALDVRHHMLDIPGEPIEGSR